MDLSNNEYEVMRIFSGCDDLIELSPKDIDKKLDFGVDKVIDLFMDLELKSFVEWTTLDLMKLELERSNREIYEEIYNSKARLAQKGSLFIETCKITPKVD